MSINSKDVNESLRGAFVRYWATKAMCAALVKDDFAPFTQEEITPGRVAAEVQTILFGGRRGTFGVVSGMAAARAQVLEAQLSGDVLAATEARSTMASLISRALHAHIAERDNAEAEAKKASVELKMALASSAHAVLSQGAVIYTALLDDESIRMLAAALIAEADWTEPTATAKANLQAQVGMSDILLTTMRGSRVKWIPDVVYSA
jgi:hypothetical protein